MRVVKWALLSLCLLGIASNQLITRTDVINEVAAGRMAWQTSQPVGWAGSNQIVSRSDFVANLKNTGSCAGTTLQVLTYSQYIACAVTVVTHTPVLLNNTFTGGGFTSWTSTNASACSGALFSGQNVSADEDSDSGQATASSLACSSTAAQVTLNQSFSTTAPPTSQTYSYWYNAPTVQYGDPTNCTQGTGTASLALVINGTTVVTTTPTLDGAWHQVSGTTTAMVNGANTFKITATLAAAVGQSSQYNPTTRTYSCRPYSSSAQPMSIDNIVLSAVW